MVHFSHWVFRSPWRSRLASHWLLDGNCVLEVISGDRARLDSYSQSLGVDVIQPPQFAEGIRSGIYAAGIRELHPAGLANPRLTAT